MQAIRRANLQKNINFDKEKAEKFFQRKEMNQYPKGQEGNMLRCLARDSTRHVAFNPANIYLFKINNRKTNKRCGICSKLTIKTHQKYATDIVLVSLLLTLNVFHTFFKCFQCFCC